MIRTQKNKDEMEGKIEGGEETQGKGGQDQRGKEQRMKTLRDTERDVRRLRRPLYKFFLPCPSFEIGTNNIIQPDPPPIRAFWEPFLRIKGQI